MELYVTATSRHVLYSFYHRTSVLASFTARIVLYSSGRTCRCTSTSIADPQIRMMVYFNVHARVRSRCYTEGAGAS